MNNIPNPNDTRLGPFHVPYHHQYKKRPHQLTFGARVGVWLLMYENGPPSRVWSEGGSLCVVVSKNGPPTRV